MTPKEHKLVASMFAKQLQYIGFLLEILQSKGITEGDDIAAYLSVSKGDPLRNARALQTAMVEYSKTAKEIGLKVIFPPTAKE